DQYMNYRELANDLAEYVRYMGYTHVELMGICEYPLDPSWGYQVTGYYAPTARYGSPEDFQYFVDHLHQEGIGVILDWVPAHFPRDEHGLAEFDGSKLYEYADPLRAEYPEWGTLAFDLGKKEVSNFLIGSALFWVNKYHIDALRVDAVAAMLYNNFSRSQWRPNIYGGELNLESMEFFRHLNSQLRQRTSAFMIAEDSSAIEGVTRDVSEGGLGFGLKWNMGWMNDTLRYMAKDPIYKRYHHDLVTNVLMYAFTERFILPLSHDEVVYGKGSMLNKFPGNMMDKMGGLKTCYTMQIGFPGKKLLFMGQDFAQENEWDVRKSIDWHLADQEWHRDVMNCVRALLALYKRYPVLYDDTGDYTTFEWINYKDAERSIFSYIRRNPWNYNNALVFIHNYTPVQRDGYVAGVPVPGTYKRVFTTYPDGDSLNIKAKQKEADGREYRLEFDLRPLESVILEIPAAPAKKPRKRTAKASAAAKTTKTTKTAKTAKDAQSAKADASKSAKARRP
ncbi:MAG: 1,4-alpha-glucan branching protein GlgB, partial [Oscillospiraceae bacterium]|nr:1,4-alpha-glucan branching protein GlgB [Oscillospiraceae bacterium]